MGTEGYGPVNPGDSRLALSHPVPHPTAEHPAPSKVGIERQGPFDQIFTLAKFAVDECQRHSGRSQRHRVVTAEVDRHPGQSLGLGGLLVFVHHPAGDLALREQPGGHAIGGREAAVEFDGVVDAVRCAVDVQRGTAERNVGVPQDKRIELRIGINVGDIVIDGDDILGDGVNIAARLEGLAEPGGVLVSRAVRDQVRDRLELAFEDLGERELKNIARPVRVYRVQSLAKSIAAPARGEALPLPDKPSIAVLPLVNMGGDAEHEFFTDGLTEDIITDISNVPGFFVIARNSTFVYKGKPTDVRQIARDLGVRYILEGSARRAAQRLRVNVQLIDAVGGGAHIFAERFDREIVEIFTVQDEITRRVVEAITGRLITGPIVERRRPTNLEAYDLCVSSRSLHTQSRSGNLEGRALLERAVALAPDYCEARPSADVNSGCFTPHQR